MRERQSAREVRLGESRALLPQATVWGKGLRYRLLTKRPGEALVWRPKSKGTRIELGVLPAGGAPLAPGNTYLPMVWVMGWGQVKGPQPAVPRVLSCHGLPGTC